MAASDDRSRSCEGKSTYTKREAAERVNASREPLRAYECRHCPSWHVGHRQGSNGYPRR